MRFFLGIDPGVTGGYALVSDSLTYAACWKSHDNYPLLVQEFKKNILTDVTHPALTVLEHVHASPIAGKKAMFTFGTSYGAWLGMLSMAGLSYDLVAPSKWQRAVFDSIKDVDNKKLLSIAYARRRFPDIMLKKGDHGEADALNIALYARSSFMGLTSIPSGVQ